MKHADVAGMVATLWHPPTLPPLLAQLEAGCGAVFVEEGQRTNHAWNAGIAKARAAGFRYLIVANDDIEVRPADWIDAMVAKAREGISLVIGPMLRRGVTLKRHFEIHGVHPGSGHLFLLDLSLPVPPIPHEFHVMYGDDWLFYWHKCLGRIWMSDDARVVCHSGEDVGLGRTCGFTQHDPRTAALFGETADERRHKDWAHLSKHFVIKKVLNDNGEWVDNISALRPEMVRAAMAGVR